MKQGSLIIFIILTSIYSFGQNSPDNFLVELKKQKIDTICQFEDYSVGYYRVYTDDELKEYCKFEPTYFFWKDKGKTFLTKKDSCFEYSIVEIDADKVWKNYFDNRKSIKIEKVKNFQFVEVKNGKKTILTTMIDHSHHQNFKFILKNEIVEKKFDDFDLEKFDGDGKGKNYNINYEHNMNLKSKILIDKIDELILKNKNLLTRKNNNE